VKKVPQIDVVELRRSAEERLGKGLEREPLAHLALLHELQVHQIELEMQNEELRLARTEAETALGKYTDLYEFAPVGYVTLDRKGIIQSVNLTGSSLLGVERSKLNKSRFELLIAAGPDRPGFAAYLEGVFSNRDNKTYELELLRSGKTSISLHIEAVLADSGLECNLVLVDISERKGAEALRKVAEAAAVALLKVEVAAAEALLKLEETLAVPQNVNEAITVALLKLEKAAEVACLKVKTAAEVAAAFIGAGETAEDPHNLAKTAEAACQKVEKAAEVAQQKVMIAAETALRKVTIVEDERTRAKNVLLASEERFRLLVDGVKDYAIIMLDVDGRVISWNEGAKRLKGWEEQEILGRHFSLFYPEQAVAASHPEQELEIAGATGQYEEEGWRVRSDGSQFMATVLITAIRDEFGKLKGFSKITRDITERKQAEETLKRYAQLLIEQEENLRKSIAMELHDDVGQELTALGLNLAYIDKFLRTEGGIDLRPVLGDSRMLAKEINRTVRNLMNDLRPSQLDEYGLAPTIRAYVEQYAHRTGLAVTVHAAANFPRLSPQKEIALFRVIQEALNNVIKHATATKVAIVLSRDANSLGLSITDDGKGLVPQVSPGPMGFGHGLTTMRERAELVGGKFRLETTPGKGTSIVIELKEGQQCLATS